MSRFAQWSRDPNAKVPAEVFARRTVAESDTFHQGLRDLVEGSKDFKGKDEILGQINAMHDIDRGYAQRMAAMAVEQRAERAAALGLSGAESATKAAGASANGAVAIGAKAAGASANGAAASAAKSATTAKALPKGMGKAGLVAAAVACVAVIGTASYLHHKKKQETKNAQWTDRIDARRAQAAARGTGLGA